MHWIEYEGKFINLANVNHISVKLDTWNGVKKYYLVFQFAQGEWMQGEGFLNDIIEAGSFDSKEKAEAEIRSILSMSEGVSDG